MDGAYGLIMLMRGQVASEAVAAVGTVALVGTVVAMVVAMVEAMAAVAAAATVATMATGVVVVTMELQVELGATLLLEAVTALPAAILVETVVLVRTLLVALAQLVVPQVVMGSLLVPIVTASAATRMITLWMISLRTTSLTATLTRGASLCPLNEAKDHQVPEIFCCGWCFHVNSIGVFSLNNGTKNSVCLSW